MTTISDDGPRTTQLVDALKATGMLDESGHLKGCGYDLSETCACIQLPALLSSALPHLTPAPQAEGDVREAVLGVLVDHRPEWRGHGDAGRVVWVCTCGSFWSRVYEHFLAHLADAVLSSGLVVPVGEVERRVADAIDNVIEHKEERFAERAEPFETGTPPSVGFLPTEDVVEALADLSVPVQGYEFGAPASPASIPARLLSGEHVGREVVLPDGTRAALVKTEAYLVLTGARGVFARFVAPDDVVALVAETEADQ